MLTHNLGYPRIGLNRELKTAVELFWKKESAVEQLEKTANSIKAFNWNLQRKNNIDLIPSNDFSFYDQVLDMCLIVDAIPPRFRKINFENQYEAYFALARGYQPADGDLVHPMEMTKWFNTNYHYIVPEISLDTLFKMNLEKPLNEFLEAQKLGIQTVPVIIGPVTFLMLSKPTERGVSPLRKLGELLPIYDQIFSELGKHGVEWIQIDEPYLVSDLGPSQEQAYQSFFTFFRKRENHPKCILTSYFGDVFSNADLISLSPFAGLHIDLINSSHERELSALAKGFKYLSLGIIDGRNIWQTDLSKTAERIKAFQTEVPDAEIIISTSCSMLHVPQDIQMETALDAKIQSWMAFGTQKLEELDALKTYFKYPTEEPELFNRNKKQLESRKKFHKKGQTEAIRKIDPGNLSRNSSYKVRKKIQDAVLGLPLLPTTTIGSYPQTKAVRLKRSQSRKGILKEQEYVAFLKGEIGKTIRIQEDLGLDVLVHGEFERNDMVQYFAEQLDGFVFTQHGWVQSFGSRYVRPPIIFGDVNRPQPMTVKWATFAQSLTKKPVKGMLTGPVTILQWSFVRDDQPREVTCQQIAFAIRQEVIDLEEAGIQVIQIDEPAFREGLPLRRGEWESYLRWAVNCFRIASSGVRDETQIHTHMCYSEFNDIIAAIADMDADVISIEASRSKMDLLKAFIDFEYPNEIGPGVYDIHSPGIPSVEEIVTLIQKALQVIPKDRLWVNPDCGLKTRQWDEVIPSLRAMVQAARTVRQAIQQPGEKD